MTALSIVVPCYNEEAVLPATIKALDGLRVRLLQCGKIDHRSRLYFVDDGSRDETWTLIEAAAAHNNAIVGIKLAANAGHQNALLAGLFSAEGDAVVSIDADLQDDINVIEAMVDHFHEGADIVYGVRDNRDTDSFFKRNTALAFYSLMRHLGTPTISNHADFRLMSRRAISALQEFREVNFFLRGVVPLLGFTTAVVTYRRAPRLAGETKYPLRKMLALAMEAITSFSVIPLRAVAGIGLSIFIGTIIVSLWVLWTRFFSEDAIPGWASTVLPVFLLSGVQLLCLGIIGEYVGKIYKEAKRRPRFTIEKLAESASAQVVPAARLSIATRAIAN